MKFDDLTDYDKGIFWAIGSYADNRFVFRHQNLYFIERMQIYTDNEFYEQIHKDKSQFVLKTSNFDYQSFIDSGWTNRNAESRNVPILDNYKDFLRAYIELHSSLKYSTRYRRGGKEKYKALKLIVYGNITLIESLNNILNHEIGVSKKKPQIVSDNGKTATLDYTNFEEINKIYDYIFDNPYEVEYWTMVNKKLNNPIIV